jgi:predicted transcriptional regulator
VKALTMGVRKEKRSREKIIYQILEACYEGANITTVVDKVALNNIIANSYIEMLIEKGMIQEKNRLYIITAKGARILPIMKNIQDTLTNSKGS